MLGLTAASTPELIDLNYGTMGECPLSALCTHSLRAIDSSGRDVGFSKLKKTTKLANSSIFSFVVECVYLTVCTTGIHLISARYLD